MTRAARLAIVALAACAAADVPAHDPGGSSPLEAQSASPASPQVSEPGGGVDNATPHNVHDVPERNVSVLDDNIARVADLPPAPAARDVPAHPADIAGEPEVWLKGVTHVHAKASGDSTEPNANVIAWYEQRHYDFIFLTDHNRVSELEPTSNTLGQITLREPSRGLIVFSGIELTHNPIGCLPVGDPSRNCRIHVNLLGPTARPGKRLEWAERRSHARLDMYQAALRAQGSLGGLAQINHPQWLWGMTPELLTELSQRGVRLVEVANAAFSKWNAGDATHLSTDALWDQALMRGATIWGTASDDAHDYDGRGKYPPGGGWIVVRARRDPRAILDAIAAGRFYASNGVVLTRAGVDRGALEVEVDPAAAGSYTIELIENGRRLGPVVGKAVRRALPTAGYLRAIVTRDDGKRAWVQPARSTSLASRAR